VAAGVRPSILAFTIAPGSRFRRCRFLDLSKLTLLSKMASPNGIEGRNNAYMFGAFAKLAAPSRSRYTSVAAWNLTTSSAGIRPRSLTSWPWLLAQSRTSDELGSLLLRPRRVVPRDERRVLLTFRPAWIYRSVVRRRSSA